MCTFVCRRGRCEYRGRKYVCMYVDRRKMRKKEGRHTEVGGYRGRRMWYVFVESAERCVYREGMF